GDALFREIQQRGLTMPVVMISGYPQETNLNKLQEQGMSGWLLKPVDLGKLARLLSHVLKNENVD
ncbi:MAG: hypothetical protein ACE5FD_15685, partial [Anaerolineae bacterium]